MKTWQTIALAGGAVGTVVYLVMKARKVEQPQRTGIIGGAVSIVEGGKNIYDALKTKFAPPPGVESPADAVRNPGIPYGTAATELDPKGLNGFATTPTSTAPKDYFAQAIAGLSPGNLYATTSETFRSVASATRAASFAGRN